MYSFSSNSNIGVGSLGLKECTISWGNQSRETSNVNTVKNEAWLGMEWRAQRRDLSGSLSEAFPPYPTAPENPFGPSPFCTGAL